MIANYWFLVHWEYIRFYHFSTNYFQPFWMFLWTKSMTFLFSCSLRAFCCCRTLEVFPPDYWWTPLFNNWIIDENWVIYQQLGNQDPNRAEGPTAHQEPPITNHQPLITSPLNPQWPYLWNTSTAYTDTWTVMAVSNSRQDILYFLILYMSKCCFLLD